MFKEVLLGMRQILSTLQAGYTLHIAFDVVAVEATKEKRTRMEKLIIKYVSNVEHIRISIHNLGPAQTDSL